MKSALIALALATALSAPALAQDTTQTPPAGSMPATGDASMQAPAADPAQPPAPTPDSTMPAPPASSTMAAPMSPPPMASTPGTMSPGMSSGMPMGMANAPAAGDSANYPVCSKTVRDRCVNRGEKRAMKPS